MRCVSAAFAILTLLATAADGDVFNMGPGLTSLEMVYVGDPGNATSSATLGGVDYVYNIGKYEVTNAQYCEFLNAVADADPNGLYNEAMGVWWVRSGGISRSGESGSYEYTVRENRGNRPANMISWYDALRFTNWLHNGQRSGKQDATTTEDGVYRMSWAPDVVRNPDAKYWLPTENEWYKAAYYKGGGTNAGYWDYPTQSDAPPTGESPPGTDLLNGSINARDAYHGYSDPVNYTTEVGAYRAKPSDSAYGTFDQGGNLSEWTETRTSAFEWPECRVRGSSYSSRGTGSHRIYCGFLHLTAEFPEVGFRVAGIPEPGSITLLATATIALLAYAWRRRRVR